jgi:Fe2+ transport system protein FeoA
MVGNHAYFSRSLWQFKRDAFFPAETFPCERRGLLIRILSIMNVHDPACEEPDCRCQELGAISRGKAVVVRHLKGAAETTRRLREMGFREDCTVTVICPGGALIASVMGSRVCLSREMAGAVLVTPA